VAGSISAQIGYILVIVHDKLLCSMLLASLVGVGNTGWQRASMKTKSEQDLRPRNCHGGGGDNSIDCGSKHSYLNPTTFKALENKAASESRQWAAARQRYTAANNLMLLTLCGSRVGHGLVTTKVGGTT